MINLDKFAEYVRTKIPAEDAKINLTLGNTQVSRNLATLELIAHDAINLWDMNSIEAMPHQKRICKAYCAVSEV